MPASIPIAGGSIFISYRRKDTAFPAGWLFERLADHFGEDKIFKDVDSIELGDDFVEVISAAVAGCNVLLALIGDQWLKVIGEDGRPRLDDPEDVVRLEIEVALTCKIRVIPVLVEGTRMPPIAELPSSLASLPRRQALELSPYGFNSDTGRLVKALNRTLTEAQARQAVADHPARNAGARKMSPAGTPKLPLALASDEEQKIAVRKHPALLIKPIALALVTLLASIILPSSKAIQQNPDVLYIILIASLAVVTLLIWRFAAWSVAYLVATSQRILLVSGFRRRKVAAMSFAEITDISYRRRLLGRIFGYGDILIESATSSKGLWIIDHMSYPEQLFLELSALIFPVEDDSSDS